MSDYRILKNYFVYDTLHTDALGANFRAGEIKERKASSHCLLTEVDKHFINTPNLWRRIYTLIEGIKKPNIPGLLSPDATIIDEGYALLVYPFIKGKDLATVLSSATRSNTEMELELAFSIALEIADVLENGGSITINKQKSFHGVLTPDNILIDYDGKIYLKNYGIFPYLSTGDNPQLLDGVIQKYGEILPPETAQHKIMTPQSDVYLLANLTFRMLTGKYISNSSGESLETQLEALEMAGPLMGADEVIAAKIPEIFQRALAPDPAGRFASIKEFKEFISRKLRIEELSSATFMLAYFMNQLYTGKIEKEDAALQEELNYTIPEEKPVIEPVPVAQPDQHMMEDILVELEHQKRSRTRLFIPLVALIIILLGVSGYLFVKQQKDAEQQEKARIERAKQFEDSIAQMKADLSKQYQERLKEIEQRNATTDDEKKAQNDEIERLKKWKDEQEKESIRQLRARQASLMKQPASKPKKQQPVEPVKVDKPEIKTEIPTPKPEIKKEEVKTTSPTPAQTTAAPTVKRGDLVALDTLSFTPSKLRGDRKLKAGTLKLPPAVSKQYAGKTLAITSDVLVNERGVVKEATVKGDLPAEIKTAIEGVLKTWTYVPAEKDKVKVKVRMPVEITLAFEAQTTLGKTPTENVAPLDSVSYRPSKLRGARKLKAADLNLPSSVTRKYKGQTLTIRASILINEFGSIKAATIKGDFPQELKMKLMDVFRTKWKYVPAEKGDKKVKVWFPARIQVTF